MKTLFIAETFSYSGEQLKSLYAYLQWGLLGDSVVAWCGPCEIPFQHMVDGEDLRDHSRIAGDQMLHFVVEVFHRDMHFGVALQRLFASLVADLIRELRPELVLQRKGDDIYWEGRKLSISIASVSGVSTMVHFAVNVNNEGTPVATCALSDWKISAKDFALQVLERMQREYTDLVMATQKVRPLGSW